MAQWWMFSFQIRNPSLGNILRKPKAQDHAGSYVNVVNGSSTVIVPGPYISSASALVLDDLCVVERDLLKYAMGKVKDVNSIPNLRTLLMDEGFSDVKLKYLGGMWVMFEFDKVDTKEMVYTSEDESVHSPKKIPAHSLFSEEVSGDDSESDVEEVSETIFGDNSSSLNNNSDEMGAEEFSSLVNAKVMNNSQEVYQEINRESVDLNVVKEGGSILGFLEDMIRVGQAICEAVGNSSGILCVWEANVFKKNYATISDNFVAIYGTWLPSNSKILFVAIYAPQQASCKRVLWEYVSTLIGRWNEETIILGYFNEVRSIDERHGSCFNPSSARVFDHFISLSALVDVKLECLEGLDAMVEQTWCSFSHSDVNKMIRFKKNYRISRLLYDVGSRIRQCIVDEGLFKGVHLQGSISISHLFYADDAMFIGEWSDANLK
nr:RNA-directed DNA polymerase, eukaryota [Tanacetum cinerariifolium]